MNILTGPVFTLQSPEGDFLQASFEDIMAGRYPGHMLSGATPFQQNMGQAVLGGCLLWLLCGDRCREAPPEEVQKRIEEEASFFELFGEKTRFMQAPFSDADKVAVREGASLVATTLSVGTPGPSTLSPFGAVPLKEGEAYCPACAARDLFTFQMMVPAGGKGSGGLWFANLGTYLMGEDARDTFLLNATPAEDLGGHPRTMAALSENEAPYPYPWVDPDYLHALENGSWSEWGTPFFNHRYVRTWMPRQVFLSAEELEEPTTCMACGFKTTTSVTRLEEGRKKKGKDKDKDKDKLFRSDYFGRMKAPGGVTVGSPYHPFRRPATGPDTRISLKEGIYDLLSVAGDLIDPTNDRIFVAPCVRAAPQAVRSVSILQVNFHSGGSFADALSAEIPLHGDTTGTARALRAMAATATSCREALGKAASRAMGSSGSSKLRESALRQLREELANFAMYLRRSPELGFEKGLLEWEEYLWSRTREIYRQHFGHRLAGILKDSYSNDRHKGELFAYGYQILLDAQHKLGDSQ